MERLKSLIPNDLKQMIAESTTENLTSTCSSLLQFFRPLPQFQQVIKELSDPEMALCRKSKAAALDSKQKGNECFSKRDYVKALSYYSQALRHAPLNYDDIDVNLAATLYVNRASSMHKLGLLEECVRDCNRAIALSPDYVKAWYRRGKANASLKCYEVAVLDLEVAFNMENTLPGKNHIKEDLKMVSSELNSTKGASISTSDNKNEKLTALGPVWILLQEWTENPIGIGPIGSSSLHFLRARPNSAQVLAFGLQELKKTDLSQDLGWVAFF